MAEIKIFGYTDKISVKQGEKINFHVSADGTKTAQAQLVKLIPVSYTHLRAHET